MGGGLRAALAAGRFVVTAEIGPPRGADAAAVVRKVELLRGWVDAANLTDNQGAHVRMSSLGGSVLAQRAGVEPVMQLTWTARTLRDEGVLASGRQLSVRPNWLIGTVENPFAPPREFRARRLAKKVAAGAEFVQTQYVFDIELFERWMAELRALGMTERCAVIAGVGPIRSARMLERLRGGVPGVHVPEHVARRLRGVPAHRLAEEGVALCVETIQRLTRIPGVAGVHVMAFGFERGVPDIVRRAGVGPGVAAPASTPTAGRIAPLAVAATRKGSGHAR